MRRLFEGRAYSSNYRNWQLESLLHLGQTVITFRTLLHLGQNVITFRTLLRLGPFITFRPSTNTAVFSSSINIPGFQRQMPEYKDGLGYKLGTSKKNVTWHFFTHGAFRSSQEVVETCPCVPDRNGIWKCLFLRRGKTEIHGEKPLGARTRTNNKLNPHTSMPSTPGFETGPHRWEAGALTTAPLRIFISSRAAHCFVYWPS